MKISDVFAPITQPVSAGIEALRKQAIIWASKVVQLANMPVPAKYAEEKKALMNRAKFIKETIEKIFGVIPEFRQMNLGVIPAVIGVVGVAGAAALIAKWSLDFATLLTNVKHHEKIASDLIRQGVSTGEAHNSAAVIVKQTSDAAQSNSILGNVSKIIPFVFLGAALWVFKDKLK